MTYQLKDGLGPDVAGLTSGMIERVHPAFDANAFLADALDGYDALELTPRARQITRALRTHLPADPKTAIQILIDSLPPLAEASNLRGMEPFRYLPHVYFVSDYGLSCFETSMRAQYELTQRFSAELSIRAFLANEPERTLARLREWAGDPSEHVRRLVSEGTRPRLPWAPRLKAFQADPTPVLELLESLKDDQSLCVRRSVANNLNDISKDHPDIAIETAARWALGASNERLGIVRHALRGMIKAGDPRALAVIGARHGADAEVSAGIIEPAELSIGDDVRISFSLTNAGPDRERFLVDYRIHFVKANGETSPKLFKVATIDLEPHETRTVSRKLSVQQRTTRTHYPGVHRVDALVNGVAHPIGSFNLTPAIK